ncbi:gliding motility-associated C-terminal domain-containing protein [bacterium]|nr:gliding motility-associated C-terminal domain-containing protein [bacterium]
MFTLLDAQTWEHAEYIDFADGIFNHIELLNPDPDGTDDGALALMDSILNISMLIVYPPESNPFRLCERYNRYASESHPLVLVKIFLMPVENYNTLASIEHSSLIYSCEVGDFVSLSLNQFDGILFGIHDAYGYTDLTSNGINLTRQFAAIGNKVIVFTHSTVWRRGWNPGDYHPGFNALEDIHGLTTFPQTAYDTFNTVYRISPTPSDSIFHYPYELPYRMEVDWTHRRGQIPTTGELLYVGEGYSDYNGIYFYLNHISAYNSWGIFLNYGHQRSAPREWDVKCTINALFLAFRNAQYNGEYISSAFNPGSPAGILEAHWNCTVPLYGSLSVFIRSSMDGSTWNPWIPISEGVLDVPITGNFFQYRVEMRGRFDNLPVLHWISFNYSTEGPHVRINYPESGTVTSCHDQEISLIFSDPFGIDPTSLSILVNSFLYDLAYPGMVLMDSVLYFTREIPYDHGDTIRITLNSARNTLGIPCEEHPEWFFVVDLEPPEIRAFSPETDLFLPIPPETVAVWVTEDYTFINIEEFSLSLNGLEYPYIHPALNWDGYRFYLITSECGYPFDSSEIIVVEVNGLCDSPDYCDPNCISGFNWRFTIDGIGPQVELIFPPESLFISCDSIEFLISIEDLSGVDTSTLMIELNSYFFVFPEDMRYERSILSFTPSPSLLENGANTLTLHFVEDALGNSGGPYSWLLLFDFEPPVVTTHHPSEGEIIGTSYPSISAGIRDFKAGLDPSSVFFILNEDTIPSSFLFISDTLFLLDCEDLGLEFTEGETVSVCILASDLATICPSNTMEPYCWSFLINLSGPVAELRQPLPNTIISCDSLAVIIWIYDPNGLNESSLIFLYNDIEYTLSDPQLSLEDSLLFFSPPHSWEDNDSIFLGLIAAEDSLGNRLAEPLFWNFSVDRSPPRFFNEIPQHYSIISESQPLISISVSDSMAGVDPASLWFAAEADTYFLGHPGLLWNGLVLIFNSILAGVDFSDSETLKVCAGASDLTRLCPPNRDFYCWEILLDLRGPRARIIEPLPGTYTSCRDQKIKVEILEMGYILESSVSILINGDEFFLSDPGLSFQNDTLCFSPENHWNHEDSIKVRLESIRDHLGNALQDTLDWTFYTDYKGPIACNPIPLPGSSTYDWQPKISLSIFDSLSGVNPATITLETRGSCYNLNSPAISWQSDTLFFDPDLADLFFPELDTIIVTVQAGDSPDYCAPNTITRGPYSWWFTILDDDLEAPILLGYHPHYWPCDSAFYLYIACYDPSGIFTPHSSENYQIPYIIWDKDHEFSYDYHKLDMQLEGISGDTTWLRTIAPVPPQEARLELVFKCFVWDDDHDFCLEDRSCFESNIMNVWILPRPVAEIIEPLPFTSTSCVDQSIIISIHQNFDIQSESIILEVTDSGYTIDDQELTWVDNILTWRMRSGGFWEEGWVNPRLIQAIDIYGAPIYTPLEWSFYVDLTAPELIHLFPADEAMIDKQNFTIEGLFRDYPSGIDASTFELNIRHRGRESVLDTSSPAIFWIEPDSLTSGFRFDPEAIGLSYAAGDSFYIYLRVGDKIDYCSSNIGFWSIFFWIEPEVQCAESTDPFTPNDDGINDRVVFTYPHLYRQKATMRIYNMDSREIYSREVEPGDPKSMYWEGYDQGGHKAPMGLYMYVVESRGEILCRGTITLVR